MGCFLTFSLLRHSVRSFSVQICCIFSQIASSSLFVQFFLSEVLLVVRYSILHLGSQSLKVQSYRLDLCVLPSFPLFSNCSVFFGFCFILYTKEIFYITFQTSIKYTLLTVILTSKHILCCCSTLVCFVF